MRVVFQQRWIKLPMYTLRYFTLKHRLESSVAMNIKRMLTLMFQCSKKTSQHGFKMTLTQKIMNNLKTVKINTKLKMYMKHFGIY